MYLAVKNKKNSRDDHSEQEKKGKKRYGNWPREQLENKLTN